MKTLTSATYFIGGIAAGIALVLSCGSDGPRHADASDAGKCDCPTAEAPIAPRVKQVKQDFTIPANTQKDLRSVLCPDIANTDIVLSGGCSGNINDNIILRQSYPESGGWTCGWSNNSNVDVTVTVMVNCLVPAQ